MSLFSPYNQQSHAMGWLQSINIEERARQKPKEISAFMFFEGHAQFSVWCNLETPISQLLPV